MIVRLFCGYLRFPQASAGEQIHDTAQGAVNAPSLKRDEGGIDLVILFLHHRFVFCVYRGEAVAFVMSEIPAEAVEIV